MLEEIGHTKLMEWVAYVQLEQEEEAAAQKAADEKANSGASGRTNTRITI